MKSVKSRLKTINWIFCGLVIFYAIYQWFGVFGLFVAISTVLSILRVNGEWLITLGSSEKAHFRWEDK